MANRHISIPKSSLLRFSTSGTCYCLDLNSLIITDEKAKYFNTSENYYPKDVEDYLSSIIETNLGRLNKQLDDWIENKNEFNYPENLTKDLINAVVIQWLRNPKAYIQIKQNSIFGQFFNLPDIYFSPLNRYNIKNIQITVEKICSIFNGYKSNIILNKNQYCCSFILPTNHWVGYGNNIIFIISPYKAFVLNKENNSDLYNSVTGYKKYFRIQNDEELKPIIKKIIDEKKYGLGRVIGLKGQLEYIKNNQELYITS